MQEVPEIKELTFPVSRVKKLSFTKALVLHFLFFVFVFFVYQIDPVTKTKQYMFQPKENLLHIVPTNIKNN